LDKNLQEVILAYKSGLTRLTEKYYTKTEQPEAETIALLVNDGRFFLILYPELHY
jgi:translation initiation factor 3 subunit L